MSTEFDPNNPKEFYRVLEELLNAKGLAQESSVLKHSNKEISEYTHDTDWGETSTGYLLRLVLQTKMYVQLTDRNACEQSLKTHANEVFRAYQQAWVERVDIILDTTSTQAVESNYDKICRLRAQSIAACTQDPYSGPNDFDQLRKLVMSNITFKTAVPEFIKVSISTFEIKKYMQGKFNDYANRRNFIRQEFAQLLEVAEREFLSPVDSVLLGAVAKPDTAYIHEIWQKALARRTEDPEGAITAARTLLESVCKHILDEHQVSYDDKMDLPKLYSLTASQLNMSPSQHSELVFKQILGSCHSIVDSLGSLRNKLSDAHGKSRNPVRPAARHAELAINLAGSLTLFLIQTNESRKFQT